MSEKILCKDCKHSRASWFNRMIDNHHLFDCVHPASWYQPKEDAVVGKTQKGYFQSCSRMRSALGDECGPSGKLWEPSNKTDLFKYIKHVSV